MSKRNTKKIADRDKSPDSRINEISSEYLLAIHEQSPIPTVILDGNDSVVLINEAFSSLTGLSADDKHDLRSLLDTMCSEEITRKKVTDFIGRAKNSDGAFLREVCCIKPADMSERTVELSAYVSATAEEADNVIIKVTDISRRISTEKALRESEERYENIFENAPISIWEYDCSGLVERLDKIKEKNIANYEKYFADNPQLVAQLRSLIRVNNVNDYTVVLYGAPSKEELIQSWGAHELPEQAILFRNVFLAYLKGMKYYECETVNQTYDGRLINIILRLSFPEEKHLFNRAIATVTDITARKQAEEALRISEQRYRVLFEWAGDFIFLIKGRKIIDCNPQTMKTFGCTRDQLIEKSPLTFSPEYQPDGQRSIEKGEELSAKTLEGDIVRFEWRHLRYDGTPFDAEITMAGGIILDERYILVIGREITERKRSEKQLRESEKKFRGFIEQSADGIVLLDENGRIVEWNREMESITGKTKAEVAGLFAWDLEYWQLPEPEKTHERYEKVQDGIRKILRNGTSDLTGKPLETKIVHTDGTLKVIRQVLFPIQTDKGCLIGSIVRDVSESKRNDDKRTALNRLRDKVVQMRGVDDIEQILGAIGTALKEACIEYNVGEINVIDWSDDKPDIQAYEFNPSKGWRFYVREDEMKIIADFWKKGKTQYRRDLEQDDVFIERDLIIDLYGQVRSVVDVPFSHGTLAINNKKPDAFTEHDIAFLEEIARILTEGFTRAEDLQRLSQSEERYRTLVEQPSDMLVILLDRKGEYVYVSPQIEKFTGYSQNEFMAGKEMLKKITHPDDLPGRKNSFLKALNGETLKNLEFRWINREGEYTWFSETVFPIKNQKGEIDMVQVIIENVSERKHADEQIKKSLEEKEILLREIHHRVKNNLQVISSLLMLQADRIKDKNHLDIFTESINRIHTMSLIHMMLYQSENLSLIDFNDYINNIVANLRSMYSREAGKIDVSINTRGIFLGMDTAIPCGLIINELVSNSFKHAFPGDITGVVTMTICEEEKNTIRLSVSDNGIGLPEDFDITKADSLGLKIVNLLATHQLGGTIEIHKDRGTEITIVFER